MREASLLAPPLPEGGTIGVPAPASPYVSRSDVLRGVEWWESQGYRVKLAPGALDRDDYVAGDPARRGADLTAMFADPDDMYQSPVGGSNDGLRLNAIARSEPNSVPSANSG